MSKAVDVPTAEEVAVEEHDVAGLPFVLIGREGGGEPTRAHAQDAGLDLRASFEDPRGVALRAGQMVEVGTGVCVGIPDGHVGLVLPRSGLAFRHGITLVNSPGVIDPGYTGEIRVLLINHGGQAHHVRPGDRVAQLVLVQTASFPLVAVEALDASERGDGGFGSTGA